VNTFVAIASIGLLLDKHPFIYPFIIEFVRCIVYVYFVRTSHQDNLIVYWTYYAHLFQLVLFVLLLLLPNFIFKIVKRFLDNLFYAV